MPILQSPALAGNVLSSTTLTYSPATKSTATELGLGFTSNVAIAGGDSVELGLLGFTGASKAAGDITGLMVTGPQSGKFDADLCSWTLDAKKLRLVIGTSQSVPAAEAVAVVIGATVGIKLPRTALAADDQRVTIAFTDASGVGNSISEARLGAASIDSLSRRAGQRMSGIVFACAPRRPSQPSGAACSPLCRQRHHTRFVSRHFVTRCCDARAVPALPAGGSARVGFGHGRRLHE